MTRRFELLGMRVRQTLSARPFQRCAGFVCTNRMKGFHLHGSSVVAEMHEQLDPTTLQDHRLVSYNRAPEAARFSFHLVWWMAGGQAFRPPGERQQA